MSANTVRTTAVRVQKPGNVWSAELGRSPMKVGRLDTRRLCAIERSFTSAGSAVAESVRNSAHNKQVTQLLQRNRAAGWVIFGWVVGDGVGQTILCTKRCRCQKIKSTDLLHVKCTFIRKTVTLRMPWFRHYERIAMEVVVFKGVGHYGPKFLVEEYVPHQPFVHS